MNFMPDWTMIGTAEQMEKEIDNGFQFKGPGWYLAKDGWVALVLPVEGDSMSPQQPTNALFKFHSYSENPGAAFDAVVNAPVREDHR